MGRSRFVIGLDLGTTNTAVAFVDTRAADGVQIFEIPQLVAPGALDGRGQLPSFLFLAGDEDLTPAETALPWDPARRIVVGELARGQGARQPSRMISSGKSWLCHGGVDRHAAILPWGVQQGPRLSPVDASARVLAHVREAWDHARGNDAGARFADQEVVITVPASFDEAARELTLEAAARAGLTSVVLLEEPQAAFYAWMNAQAAAAPLAPDERVLVFDVGGGTTDFTLIAVDGDGSYTRTAVGDHLLLGGDNVDLTLAKRAEARLAAAGSTRKLDTLQWHGLVQACRLAKETLLSDPDLASLPLAVSGRGAKLIGSTLRDELTRAELDDVLLTGFFPVVERGELPRRSRGGLQEFGLPYAADAAITRHLAAFLARHGGGRVDAILFNGGAMTPPALRRRVCEQIARWQPEAGAPRELAATAPELAVAVGAAHYGLVRRGIGTRISGGTARAHYVSVGAVAGRPSAVCLAPRGLAEGAEVELDRAFTLLTNRPVSFRLFSSTTRDDTAGAVVALTDIASPAAEDAGDFVELPPVVTALRAPGRGEVDVHLAVRTTALGTLELWCREPGAPADAGGWRLTFDMRAGGAKVASETPGAAAADGGDDGSASEAAAPDPRSAEARALLQTIFAGPPEGLPRVFAQLEQLLGAPRDQWSTATARALFDAAFELEEQRKRSPHHEARWLHLCGFCLRPGTGAPLDDWRAKQMWRIFGEDLVHPGAEQCRLAWWIAWRRVAGGLNKGQQHQIYLRLSQLFVPGGKTKKKWHELKPSQEEAAEMLRCLANLERLSPEAKITLGDELCRRMEAGKKAREDTLNLWALARLGGRLPLYGPLNCVVPAGKVAAWLDALLPLTWPDPQKVVFPLAQLGRRTGDRSRDLDDDHRATVHSWLERAGAARAATLVTEIVALESREQDIAFGDTLPPGLRLAAEPADAARADQRT